MDNKRESNHIKWLDTLRGLACLIVLVAHVIARYPDLVEYSYGVGKIGVWLFMVSSGYLLMITAPKELTWKYLIKYYINKIVKIYPGLLLGLILLYKADLVTEYSDIKSTLLILSGPEHLWYIPVILKFYIVAPFLIIIEKKIEKRITKIIGIIVMIISFSVIWPFSNYSQNSVELKWYIPVFLLGVLLFYIPEKKWKKAFLWDITASISFLVIVFLTPFFRISMFHYGDADFLYNKYLIIGLLWMLMMLSIIQGKYAKKVLESIKPLQWLSILLYPVYIVHYPIIFILLSLSEFDVLILLLITFVISILISICYHFLFDRFISRFVRKLL